MTSDRERSEKFMKIGLITSVFLLLGFIEPRITNATDHIDGPITAEHGQSDITDMYAFPSPNRKNFLTLVLNSYPMAPSTAHFEENLRYLFTIRKALITASSITTDGEVRIICKFTNPHNLDKNVVSCDTGKGLRIDGKLNQINKNKSMWLWAGLRSDPFFLNDVWAKSASFEGELSVPESKNVMDKLNVLSIVMEIDSNQLFDGGATAFTVVGEIATQESESEELRLLDRVGRPEITNVSLVWHGDEEDLRDAYNIEETYSLDSTAKSAYSARLAKNISYYDKLDGSIDWDADRKNSFINILLEDHLVVDISKPCGSSNYLSIEKSVLAGKKHQLCGGRMLQEDVMDEIFAFYINTGLQTVKDGADHPYRPISNQFPYLHEPDLSLRAKLKSWLARKLAKNL